MKRIRLDGAESGATLAEYAFLLALVATVVIVTVSVLGEKLDTSLQRFLTLMN